MQTLQIGNRAPVVLVLSLALLVLAGCGTNAEETAAEGSTPAETSPTPAPAGAQEQPVQYAASHILIQFAGSQRAPETMQRTKEEALALAKEIVTKARRGDDFDALAREFSEGPSGPRGGNLGVFWSNRMVPEFSQACATLSEGQFSDPVETDFGYHVIRRNKIELAAARHILVMHTSSQRVSPTVTRSKEEALERANEALKKAQAGEDFATLAGEYSDGPSAPRGGDLGQFGKGAMVPPFEEAVFGLEIGGTSGIVETPFGYHIIQRYE